MSKRVLITGGAGFIGSHLADELLTHGYHVRVFDNLSPQVHGAGQERPSYLNRDVELKIGDVRNLDRTREALNGIDAVFHFAASVGVGQSMYRVADYVSVNNQGTANLLQVLLENPVERLVVASSMSLYGKGSIGRRTGAWCQGKCGQWNSSRHGSGNSGRREARC